MQDASDIPALVGRFQVINIKLDKCGGLSEALAMARDAEKRGLEIMVGNVTGTSLEMAPAYILGQLCKVVDLDGLVFLNSDGDDRIEYEGGMICCAENVWGGGHQFPPGPPK